MDGPVVELKDGEEPTLNHFIKSFCNILLEIFISHPIEAIPYYICLFFLFTSFLGFCIANFSGLLVKLMEKYIIDVEEYKKWKKNRQ